MTLNVFIQKLCFEERRGEVSLGAVAALRCAECYTQIWNWFRQSRGILPLAEFLLLFPWAPTSRAHVALG